MKCIRCETIVRIGSTEQCPRNPARGTSDGYHEGMPHDFVSGALDGMCNHVDPDFGLRCGFGESEWEQDIAGAPIHNLRPEWQPNSPSKADKVRMVFEFDIDREALVPVGGDDFKGKDRGITVESCASAVMQAHKASDGYIHWRVGTTNGSE